MARAQLPPPTPAAPRRTASRIAGPRPTSTPAPIHAIFAAAAAFDMRALLIAVAAYFFAAALLFPAMTPTIFV